MLKIFALILAWIALTSCSITKGVCGYKIYSKSWSFIGYPTATMQCKSKPELNKNGAYECVDHDGKYCAVLDVLAVEEACW